MADEKLRLLIIGAHPDDADYHAGGLAALYRAAGHVVKMVSMTDGSAGHQTLRGSELAKRRKAEAAASGAVIGASYDVYDNPDGGLFPSLEVRSQVIRLIRMFRPDLVLTHRPNDYHPDHRYTSMLVQDAAYLVTVPAVVPDTPHLSRDPVIAYLPDHFQKPYPFQPAVVVDVGDVFDEIVAMLHCHTSQFYEWLPFNQGNQVPSGDDERRHWLAAAVRARLEKLADRYRALLVKTYGPKRGQEIRTIEAFEACEYGAPLDEAAIRLLFPFQK
ncbi:MAG: PIG-L deacetylase family protein [Gemmataceae bacterium]